MSVSNFARIEDSLLDKLATEYRQLVAKTMNHSGFICNGTVYHRGCEKKIPIGDTYVLIDHTTTFWHPECAAKHELQPGMVSTNRQVWYFQKPKKPGAIYKIKSIDRLSTIRTQKVKGLATLKKFGFLTPPTIVIQETNDLRGIRDILAKLEVSPSFPAWARPCPPRPRHGYLESRAVITPKEVGRLWRDTLRTDTDGELMLQPMVPAKWSAVLTPYTFTWGIGNDGATAGRSARALRFETRSKLYSKMMLTQASIAPKESPYTELVWQTPNTPVFVQLRSGPTVKRVADYVGPKVKVKHVYEIKDIDQTSTESMLKWEATVPKFEKGTVVYHEGGALSTHYAVQCIINKVPYFTSRKPEIGETLTKEQKEESFNPEVLRHGILMGAEYGAAVSENADTNADTFRHALLYSMFILHNSGVDRSEFSSEMFGYAASLLFRIMSMACIGEMRHFRSTHAMTYVEEMAKPEHGWLRAYLDRTGHDDKSRNTVFEQVWAWPYKRVVREMAHVTHGLLKFNWATSMGGLLWGRSALCALRLHEASMHVVKRPSERAINNLMSRMNIAVNMVHNNGSLYNKFAQQAEINAASASSSRSLLSNVFPMMIHVEKHLAATPKVLTPKLRSWKKDMPREFAKYADNQMSLKRAVESSGSAENALGKMCAKSIYYSFKGVYEQAQEWGQWGVGYTLYKFMYEKPLSKECTGCGLVRLYKDGTPYCKNDCDGERWRFNNDRLLTKNRRQTLDDVISRWSLETVAPWRSAGQPSVFEWHVTKSGYLVNKWVPKKED